MTSTTEFKTADRAHTSFLAAAEKKALIWIASRLPAQVNSDHLTALGFISLILAWTCYWYSRFNAWTLLLVIPFLVLNWFGDCLDGTLARVRNRQRPRYGFYVDHILDALGMSFLMAGLAFSGYMSPLIGGLFLVVYLLLSIEIYLATYTIGTFHLPYWRFGPTELRILLVIGNLFVLWRPYAIVAGRNFLLFDIGFAVGAGALALILIQATVKHVVMLYREETLP